MTSPDSKCSASWPIVLLVASPAGTMTQAARGGESFSTNSARLAAGVAPFEATASRASACRSKATTSWPSLRRRSDMLAPILPSPIMPMRMDRSSLLRGARGCVVVVVCDGTGRRAVPDGGSGRAGESEGAGLVRQLLDELVEGLGEGVHALVFEGLLHVFHVDANVGELVEDGGGLLGVGVDGTVQFPVVLEGAERGFGHGVDRGRADEVVHVEQVRVGVVLGRCGS